MNHKLAVLYFLEVEQLVRDVEQIVDILAYCCKKGAVFGFAQTLVKAFERKDNEAQRGAYLMDKIDEEIDFRLIHQLLLLHTEMFKTYIVTTAHGALDVTPDQIGTKRQRHYIYKVSPPGEVPRRKNRYEDMRNGTVDTCLAQKKLIGTRRQVGIGHLCHADVMSPLLVNTLEHVVEQHALG